jgi:hypothetical protein
MSAVKVCLDGMFREEDPCFMSQRVCTLQKDGYAILDMRPERETPDFASNPTQPIASDRNITLKKTDQCDSV